MSTDVHVSQLFPEKERAELCPARSSRLLRAQVSRAKCKSPPAYPLQGPRPEAGSSHRVSVTSGRPPSSKMSTEEGEAISAQHSVRCLTVWSQFPASEHSWKEPQTPGPLKAWTVQPLQCVVPQSDSRGRERLENF